MGYFAEGAGFRRTTQGSDLTTSDPIEMSTVGVRTTYQCLVDNSMDVMPERSELAFEFRTDSAMTPKERKPIERALENFSWSFS